MKRKEIINTILDLSGEEFETKKDILELAYENKRQLKNRLITINNHIIENKIINDLVLNF
jgi:hypothetical protein